MVEALNDYVIHFSSHHIPDTTVRTQWQLEWNDETIKGSTILYHCAEVYANHFMLAGTLSSAPMFGSE